MENAVFEIYQYLPQEVRAVVVDEMQPDDRCRFTRCSKSSQKEAKSSRKFIYGLKFNSGLSNPRLRVLYAAESQGFGYILEFTNERRKNIMKCLNLHHGQEFWRTDLSSDVELDRLAFRHFKSILHDYQNVIKHLKVSTMNVEDFGVRSFGRLEEVGASYEILASQIFPKLQRPLKYLGNTEIGDNRLASCKEVYQVEDEIFSWTGFNNEQFLRLKASKLSIHIGELSVENIYNFINLWKNGKVRKNFESCAWQLSGSTFNRRQLFSLFGVEFGSYIKSEVEIKNNEDPTKIAVLAAYSAVQQMMFSVKTQ